MGEIRKTVFFSSYARRRRALHPLWRRTCSVYPCRIQHRVRFCLWKDVHCWRWRRGTSLSVQYPSTSPHGCLRVHHQYQKFVEVFCSSLTKMGVRVSVAGSHVKNWKIPIRAEKTQLVFWSHIMKSSVICSIGGWRACIVHGGRRDGISEKGSITKIRASATKKMTRLCARDWCTGFRSEFSGGSAKLRWSPQLPSVLYKHSLAHCASQSRPPCNR